MEAGGDGIPTAASDMWVTDITAEHMRENQPSQGYLGDEFCFVEEVYANRRTRSEARLDQERNNAAAPRENLQCTLSAYQDEERRGG